MPSGKPCVLINIIKPLYYYSSWWETHHMKIYPSKKKMDGVRLEKKLILLPHHPNTTLISYYSLQMWTVDWTVREKCSMLDPPDWYSKIWCKFWKGIPTLYWATPTPPPVVGGVPFCRFTAIWCSIPPMCDPFPFIPLGPCAWGCGWCVALSMEIGDVSPVSRSSASYSCSIKKKNQPRMNKALSYTKNA